MARVPLILAAVCLLLVGCSPIEERQERAWRFFERASEEVTEGVEKAQNVKEAFDDTLSGAAQKFQGATSGLQQRIEKAQEGVEKLTTSIETFKEGAEDLQEALE